MALEMPSHREAVLHLLDSGALDGLEPQHLDQALGAPDQWPHRQRRRISAWFLARDSALFEHWGERSALYPLPDERSGATALAHHRLACRIAAAELPHAVHCDLATRLEAFQELTALQLFADLRLCRQSGTDAEPLKRLLATAVEMGSWATAARLFQEGVLDAHAGLGWVQAVFHRLDWSLFGPVKMAFARRTPLVAPPAGRFLGLQQLARGQAGVALTTLLAAAQDAPGEATVREAGLAAAGAGRVDPRLARLAAPGPAISSVFAAQMDWLLRLARPGARLGEQDLERLAELELPAATDPLFGALALGIVRALPAVLRTPERWDAISGRLGARNRRWRRDLPTGDREWLVLLRDLRRPNLTDAALVCLLRRTLLLPVARCWMTQALAALRREDRLQRLARPDGSPTELGLLVRTLCIRAVDGLPGLLLGTPQEEQAMLSCDPQVVLGALSAALDRPSQDGRPR